MRNSIMEGKKGSLLWVLILVLVILIVVVAAALKFMPKESPPQPGPAVSRAKVPPLPPPAQSPMPQVTEAATPPGEPKSPDAGPAPGPNASPPAKDEIVSTDLKAADSEKGVAEKTTDSAKPPAESGAKTQEPKVPLAPPTVSPKMEAAQPAQKNDSAAAGPPAPTSGPHSTPAPPPKELEVKPKEETMARMDLDKMAPYTLQVGAFRNKSNADEVLSQLTKKGYAPFLFQVTDAQQRSFYMVRFGHFGSREEAAKALEAFKLKEKQDAVIVRSGMM